MRQIAVVFIFLICNSLSLFSMVNFESSQPYILIIMVNECTYSDLPIYIGTNVKKSNIDRLASQSMKFNKTYETKRFCVPCLAELYTAKQATNPVDGWKTFDFKESFSPENRHFQNSPNQSEFSSTVIQPGELDKEFENGKNTFWAPDIIYINGNYHLFVTHKKGVRNHWGGKSNIAHYSRENIWDWNFEVKFRWNLNN